MPGLPALANCEFRNPGMKENPLLSGDAVASQALAEFDLRTGHNDLAGEHAFDQRVVYRINTVSLRGVSFSDTLTLLCSRSKMPYVNCNHVISKLPNGKCSQRLAGLLPLTVHTIFCVTRQIGVGLKGSPQVVEPSRHAIADCQDYPHLRSTPPSFDESSMRERYERGGSDGKHPATCLSKLQPVAPVERIHACNPFLIFWRSGGNVRPKEIAPSW